MYQTNSKGANNEPLLFFSVFYGLIASSFHFDLVVPTGWLSSVARPENHIVSVKERFRNVAVGERLVVPCSNDLKSFLDKM